MLPGDYYTAWGGTSFPGVPAAVIDGYGNRSEDTTTTRVAVVERDRVTTTTIDPADAGFPPAPLNTLLVNNPADSAAAVRSILAGEPGPRRNHAVLNAAAAIVVYGIAADLPTGVHHAEQALNTGAAARQLDALVELTNK